MSYLLYQRTSHSQNPGKCQNLHITNSSSVPTQSTPKGPPLLVTISVLELWQKTPSYQRPCSSTEPQVGWLPMQHPYFLSACPVQSELVLHCSLSYLGHQLQQRHPAGPEDILITRTTGSPPIPKLSPLSAKLYSITPPLTITIFWFPTPGSNSARDSPQATPARRQERKQKPKEESTHPAKIN